MSPRIRVFSRDEMSSFRCEVRWAGISITTDCDGWPDIDPTNCSGLLRLRFADLEKPVAGERLIDEADAVQILDFVADMWSHIELLVVHCHAGLRRSPAVAAAISRIYLGDDSQWFQFGIYDPNMFVYATLLTVAQQRGEFREPHIPRLKRRKRGRRR